MKNPWEEYPHIWRTESSWWGYLRGCLRKAWVRFPPKLELIKEKRKQITNPNPKGNKPTVWGAECELCHKEYVLKDIQVDHKNSAGSLMCVDDIQTFVEGLLFVGKNELQLVCKNCHGIKTYADKHNISFKEAKVVKQAIELQRDKKDKKWLEIKGVVPASNATKRREQIIQLLNKEK